MARFASVAKFAKNVAQKTLEVFCLRAPLSPSFTAVDRKLEKLTMRYKAPAFDMNELQLMYHALTVKGDVYRFRGDIIDEGLSQLVSSFESEPLFEERSWPRWMQLELLIRSEEVALQKWERERSIQDTFSDRLRSAVRRMPATPTLNLLRQTSRNKSCSAKDFRSEIQEYCFWVMNLEAERCSDYMRPHGGTPNSLLERMSLYVAYLNRPYKTCFNTGDDVVRSFCWKLADKVDKKDPKVIQRLRDLGLGVWPNCPRSWRFLNPE